MYILCLLAFQSKIDYFHSQANLSTFFFENHHTRISIKSKSNTDFFINSPIPGLSYYIIQNNNNTFFRKKGKIEKENEYIHINNANYSRAYFSLSKEAIRKYNSTDKVFSISFLSYIDDKNICSNGVEFIHPKKKIQIKNSQQKCFYYLPNNQNPAILYVGGHIYSSSNNHYVQNKEKAIHSELLSSKDIKDSKILMNSIIFQNYSCKYGKKYLPVQKSVFSIINSNCLILLIVCSTIFMIFLCAGKQSVGAINPNDNCQTIPINRVPNNNIYYDNNQSNNCYNVPPPMTNPMLPMNQIRPVDAVNQTNPIHQMNQLYSNDVTSQSNPMFPMNQIRPINAVNQTNPIHQMNQLYSNDQVNQTSPIIQTDYVNPANSMNTNPYLQAGNMNGNNCTYHNIVQPNVILPPSNASTNQASSCYPGVVQYTGALPMRKSTYSANQFVNYYQQV